MLSTSDPNIEILLSALKLDPASMRRATFHISDRSPMPGWILYAFDVKFLPIYLLEAKGYGLTQVYSFAAGINKEAFILICDLGGRTALVAKRPGKEGNPLVRRVLSFKDDYEKVAGVLRKIDLSNYLMAHSTLLSAVGLLHEGAERDFVNLGLFSNYFLRERMMSHLSQRGRSISKESADLCAKLSGELSVSIDGAKRILDALGYELRSSKTNNAEEYYLSPKNAAARRSNLHHF
jgi:hypothetical protein